MTLLKRKRKFDKYSARGFIYAGIAILGIGYELLFSRQIRPLLIIGYCIVIAVAVFYFWFVVRSDQL